MSVLPQCESRGQTVDNTQYLNDNVSALLYTISTDTSTPQHVWPVDQSLQYKWLNVPNRNNKQCKFLGTNLHSVRIQRNKKVLMNGHMTGQRQYPQKGR